MAEQLPLQFEFRADLTFNDYFCGGTNRETVSHLQECIEGSGERLIFIWGQPGLGKTHLLQACCHNAQTLSISSFYLDLAIKPLPDPAILDGLEQFELLCFDNIEHLCGNDDWERAFFNLFNRQQEADHKLILSSATAPKELAVHLPDLQTRLNWGLTLKLQPLNDSDRIDSLIFKADRMGFSISPKAGRFLLTHYDREPQALWALLKKLDKASLAAKRKLTLPFLKQILNEQSHD